MALPTIGGETWSSRAAWRSSASDLSYLIVDRRGRLQHVGELERRFIYANSDDDEDGSGDATTSMYKQMLPDAMSQGVTAAGGLGLARVIYDQLRLREGGS